MLALGATLAGCQLPLEQAACPCAEGWVCCPTSNLCVPGTGDRCPSDPGPGGSDAGPDSSPDSGGGSIPEIQRLQLQHGWTGDQFGRAIAFSGGLVAVGVPGYAGSGTNQGAVVLFERRGGGTGVWVRLAVLVAPDAADDSGFGQAVAIAGPEALVVGAPRASRDGRVYLFRRVDERNRVAGAWVWQQTIAPDSSDVPGAGAPPLQFGGVITADSGRALIVANSAGQLYDVAPGGATHVARLEIPGGGRVTAAVLRGSSAVFATGGIYEIEDVLGPAAPAKISDASVSPVPLAFDGQRVAIGRTGGVRILERTATGWSVPVDLDVPSDPSSFRAPELAWYGGQLIVIAQQASSVLGLTRARSIGGAWQLDPVSTIVAPVAFLSRVVAGSDRVMVSVPNAPLGGATPGQVTLFRVDDTGVAAESSLAFDEPALQSGGSMVARSGQILANASTADRAFWFAREAGQYQRRMSLVVDSGVQILPMLAVSRSAALVVVQRPSDSTKRWVQTFDLGERDWTAGQALTAPEAGLAAFPSSVAVDGDIAAITAQRRGAGIALVYDRSAEGWAYTTALDSRLECAPHAVIAGERMALFCINLFRLYERRGSTWYELPVPVLPEPSTAIHQLVFSGDVLGVASLATDGYVVSDVFRWTDSGWRAELHLRSDRPRTGCQVGCVFGVAAVSADRLLVYRDATTVTPYGFSGGVWTPRALIELPPMPRAPGALVQAVALSGDEVIESVALEGDGLDPRAAALYVFPWR